MASVGQALEALGITNFSLNGEPTSENEFNSMFKKITGADSNNVSILSSNSEDFGVTWSNIKTKYDEMLKLEPMNELRSQRNKLLSETDWMGNQDYSITDAWKTYRQALRDVTSQTPSDNTLSNINWPTKPS